MKYYAGFKMSFHSNPLVNLYFIPEIGMEIIRQKEKLPVVKKGDRSSRRGAVVNESD